MTCNGPDQLLDCLSLAKHFLLLDILNHYIFCSLFFEKFLCLNYIISSCFFQRILSTISLSASMLVTLVPTENSGKLITFPITRHIGGKTSLSMFVLCTQPVRSTACSWLSLESVLISLFQILSAILCFFQFFVAKRTVRKTKS